MWYISSNTYNFSCASFQSAPFGHFYAPPHVVLTPLWFLHGAVRRSPPATFVVSRSKRGSLRCEAPPLLSNEPMNRVEANAKRGSLSVHSEKGWVAARFVSTFPKRQWSEAQRYRNTCYACINDYIQFLLYEVTTEAMIFKHSSFLLVILPKPNTSLLLKHPVNFIWKASCLYTSLFASIKLLSLMSLHDSVVIFMV